MFAPVFLVVFASPLPINTTEIEAQDDPPRMVNIGSVLGAGYNLLTGNPAASGRDPGFMTGGQVIRKTYSGQTSDDG